MPDSTYVEHLVLGTIIHGAAPRHTDSLVKELLQLICCEYLERLCAAPTLKNLDTTAFPFTHSLALCASLQGANN